MASGATGVKFELINVDEIQEKKKPSVDAVVSIRFEGMETDLELNEDSETHGSSERQVAVHTASDSAGVVWDGAAERANRGRDIYWVSLVLY